MPWTPRTWCEAPSPPQWDDRTAFDAQVDYRTRSGKRRFLAVETKYTEPFTQTRYDRALYRQIHDESGWFQSGPVCQGEVRHLWYPII